MRDLGVGMRREFSIEEEKVQEMELLEFSVGGGSLGIDVANIRELLQHQPIQPLPHTHACVEGIICPRGEALTVIDLAAYLHESPSANPDHDIFIIADCGKERFAFHVHRVMGIQRIAKESIQRNQTAEKGGADGIIAGVVQVANRIVILLDITKILADLSLADEESIQAS